MAEGSRLRARVAKFRLSHPYSVHPNPATCRHSSAFINPCEASRSDQRCKTLCDKTRGSGLLGPHRSPRRWPTTHHINMDVLVIVESLSTLGLPLSFVHSHLSAKSACQGCTLLASYPIKIFKTSNKHAARRTDRQTPDEQVGK